MKASGASIIGIQESRERYQRQELMALIGAGYAITSFDTSATSFKDDVSVIYDTKNHTLLNRGVISLGVTGKESYYVNWVRLQYKNTNIRYYVFNVHLDHTTADGHVHRVAQMKKILSSIQSTTGSTTEPIFLIGDFNADTGTDPLKLAVNAGYVNTRNAAPGPIDKTKTWAGFQPVGDGYKRDHIFYKQGSGYTVKTLSYKTDKAAYKGSDHLPVIAKVTILDKKAEAERKAAEEAARKRAEQEAAAKKAAEEAARKKAEDEAAAKRAAEEEAKRKATDEAGKKKAAEEAAKKKAEELKRAEEAAREAARKAEEAQKAEAEAARKVKEAQQRLDEARRSNASPEEIQRLEKEVAGASTAHQQAKQTSEQAKSEKVRTAQHVTAAKAALDEARVASVDASEGEGDGMGGITSRGIITIAIIGFSVIAIGVVTTVIVITRGSRRH